MSSDIENALRGKAAVLQHASLDGNSWSKLAKNLLSKLDVDGHFSWNDLPPGLTWEQLPSDATWSEVAQGSLFDNALSVPPNSDFEFSVIEDLANRGVQMTLCIETSFPKRVLESKPSVPFLFHRGNFDSLDSKGVAIIGTRKASDAALQAASRFASELAKNGIPVISGLAAGIDTAALKSAIDLGGRVVAVIGTGIDRCYPAENRNLQDRIGNEGMVISQFLPDASPTKKSFPMRNAVMSSYAESSLVIQADERSGARLQARIASEQGRKVFLYEPIMKFEPWAKSMVDLNRAQWVTNSEQIFVK